MDYHRFNGFICTHLLHASSATYEAGGVDPGGMGGRLCAPQFLSGGAARSTPGGGGEKGESYLCEARRRTGRWRFHEHVERPGVHSSNGLSVDTKFLQRPQESYVWRAMMHGGMEWSGEAMWGVAALVGLGRVEMAT
jgi:hypothetical protein